MCVDAIVTKLPNKEFDIFRGPTSPNNLIKKIFVDGRR